MPIMPPWTNDHDIAHLYAKAVQINLIPSDPAQWLLISSVYQIRAALVMPMGTPIMPPLGNDQNNAHLHAKTTSMNLTWNESGQ